MTSILLIEQVLNGIGYGLMLFLLAAGLTLVFGVMDVLNLAHGSLFMAGAYVAAQVHTASGSFALAVAAAIVLVALLAVALELLLVRRLYGRDHLSQVLATFGVILVADDIVKIAFGPAPVMASAPAALSLPVEILPGLPYPSYRLLILGAGVAVALALYLLVNHTRLGMLLRAGASNRAMAEFMGVRVGMGEEILIPSLVVLVIGGIGSVRGAFVAALLVGLVDTLGRAFVPGLLKGLVSPALAADLGPALAQLATYALMALVLAFRPAGLFPARG